MLIDVKPINSILFAVDGIIIRLIAGFNRLFCHCFDLDEIHEGVTLNLHQNMTKLKIEGKKVPVQLMDLSAMDTETEMTYDDDAT